MTDYKSDATLLFDPMKLGNIKLANRFVCSATYEALAGENGEVTSELIERYERLANGGVGLCITGMMYFHGTGRGYRYQTGIHNDRMLPGLTKLTEAVHKSGGKIAFQLAHAGRQTTKEMIGRRPLAPSSQGRDPMYFVKPAEMTEEQIETIIHSATWAALRAVKAGADGIQLHAAHGYLYNQFLSPYFNTRDDGWGKNAEKRFELLKQTYTRIREAVPKGFQFL